MTKFFRIGRNELFILEFLQERDEYTSIKEIHKNFRYNKTIRPINIRNKANTTLKYFPHLKIVIFRLWEKFLIKIEDRKMEIDDMSVKLTEKGLRILRFLEKERKLLKYDWWTQKKKFFITISIENLPLIFNNL